VQEVEHDVLQRIRFELELVRNIAAQVGERAPAAVTCIQEPVLSKYGVNQKWHCKLRCVIVDIT